MGNGGVCPRAVRIAPAAWLPGDCRRSASRGRTHGNLVRLQSFQRSSRCCDGGKRNLACAAGLVVLEELENGLMENVRTTGEYLRKRLQELQEEFPAIIRDVRGAGAMMGLGLHLPADPFVQELLNRKIIANSTSETVIRLLPPYIFQPEHVDELVLNLRSIFQTTQA
ncbi:MAG: aminotransferase class III-fold pyridoxal phosphate-dependent enzyme [Chlorobi bacterium CHB2]|nr:aminotransferase class III-fold pyridoxal phosphate-dependent enzyme [Chlorobi bacterium CHB2]